MIIQVNHRRFRWLLKQTATVMTYDGLATWRGRLHRPRADLLDLFKEWWFRFRGVA